MSEPQRSDVTADKPGRWIGVDLERPEDRTGDLHPWDVSLSIEPLSIEPGEGSMVVVDHWTWLTPEEARAVAAALIEGADRADARRARDPRDDI